MTTLKQLETRERPNWCPGCGDFGIWNALKNAIVKLNLDPSNVLIVSGIGCGSKMPHWINCYGLHTIHGRALPVATGAKLSNSKLTVFVIGGDGDGYGIGGNHFIHAIRRNVDIVYIVQDNKIYGLTKGQMSPTSDQGMKTKSSPFGSIEVPVNPLALALGMDCSFIARGYAGEIEHLTDLIVRGVKHKGLAFIDVLQPCVSFNPVNTYDWYGKRVYKLPKPLSRNDAFVVAQQWEDKIPIGLFFESDRDSYEEGLPQLAKRALVDMPIKNVNISKNLKELE